MNDASSRPDEFPYDVALSFASEQRNYVDKVAKALRRRGIKPFYDKFEESALWGKELHEHLDDVYRKQARYCVLFASKAYAAKVWTTHERRSAQARALESNNEYVLPVRFDGTEIPGLRPTVAYIDAGTTMPAKLAHLIAQKIGPRQRENYLPPNPDRLYAAISATSKQDKDACRNIAAAFLEALEQMTADERRVITVILDEGCPVELPENVHMELDAVRRKVKMTPNQVIDHVKSVSSLGFKYEVRADEEHEGEVIVLRWFDK